MPTGFNVETGSDLSERLANFAEIISDQLRKCRADNSITPAAPCSGADIIGWIKHTYNTDISGSDVRAVVNFLRRNKTPIGSNQDGYFFAVNLDELAFTRNHLRERIAAIQSALTGVTAAFDDKDQLLL